MLANLWNRIIIEALNNLDTKMLKKYRIDVDFELRNNFIYYINSNLEKHTRLCIFII